MREGGVRMSSLSPQRWQANNDGTSGANYHEWYDGNGVTRMYTESTPYYTHVSTQWPCERNPWAELAEHWSSDD